MSDSILYTGSTGARELTPRFTKRHGVWTTTRRWRGLQSELLAISATLSDPDASLTQEDEFWWLLESDSPGLTDDPNNPPSLDDQVVTLWGLQSSKLSKSIWTLQKVTDEIDALWGQGGITDEERQGVARFRADLIALARGEEVSLRAAPDDTAGEPTEEQVIKITLADILQPPIVSTEQQRSVWLGLFQTLTEGIEAYPVDAFVLRKRAVAPNGANLSPAYENTNRAIATARLKADEPSIPNTLGANLPFGYWFKGAPNVDQTDANRFEIVQEWVHADTYNWFIYEEPLT